MIQAQIGHVSPQMMKTYSHIRRQALNEAAAVLEPTFEFTPPSAAAPDVPTERADQPEAGTVRSQVTSQSDDLDEEMTEILKEIGSPSWTRIELSAWCRGHSSWAC